MESNHSSEEELEEIIRAEPAKQSLPSDNRHRTQNESERLVVLSPFLHKTC